MSGMITKVATNLNGISIAYVMGVANGLFAVLVAFGIHMSDQEIGSLMGLINAVLIGAVHFGHRVGEATAAGSATAQSAQAFPHTPQAAETPAK